MSTDTKIHPALEHKETGNAAFKCGDWEGAVDAYTDAIRAIEQDHKERPTLFNNRAAAYLKLEQYEAAITDCTVVLATLPQDPKALFRRSQAREALEQFEEAYKDAVALWKADPSNKPVQKSLERLHLIVQARVQENAQTANKIQQMAELVFNPSNVEEKRKSAMNNLLVLARDSITADLMLKSNIVAKLQGLLKVEKNKEICLNAVRTVDELCNKSVVRTKAVLQAVGIPWFLDILDTSDAEKVCAI